MKVFLSFLFVALMFFGINRYYENIKQRENVKKSFLSISRNDISSFTVNHFINSQNFVQNQGEWYIEPGTNKLQDVLKNQNIENKSPTFKKEKIDSNEVNRVLDLLFAETVGVPHDEMDSDDSKIYEINEYSLHIIFKDKLGSELETVYFGKDGPESLSVFAKLKASSKIYLLNKDYRLLFLRPEEEWKSK